MPSATPLVGCLSCSAAFPPRDLQGGQGHCTGCRVPVRRQGPVPRERRTFALNLPGADQPHPRPGTTRFCALPGCPFDPLPGDALCARCRAEWGPVLQPSGISPTERLARDVEAAETILCGVTVALLLLLSASLPASLVVAGIAAPTWCALRWLRPGPRD